MAKISTVNNLTISGAKSGDIQITPDGSIYIVNNRREFQKISFPESYKFRRFLHQENLNDLNDTGLYIQTIDSDSTLNRNYPISFAGILNLYSYGDNTVFQEYTILTNSSSVTDDILNQTYRRFKKSNGWSDWQLITLKKSHQEWIETNKSKSFVEQSTFDEYKLNNQVDTTLFVKHSTADNYTYNGEFSFKSTTTQPANKLVVKNTGLTFEKLRGASYNTLFKFETDSSFNLFLKAYNPFQNNQNEKSLIQASQSILKFGDIGVGIYFNNNSIATLQNNDCTVLVKENSTGRLYQKPFNFVTQEADPTVPSFVKQITQNDITSWNNTTNLFYSYDSNDRNPNVNSVQHSKIKFGFGSYNQHRPDSTYGDYLIFGGYVDNTGGRKNMLILNKSTFGIRQYQATNNSTAKFTEYAEFWHSRNFNPDEKVNSQNGLTHLLFESNLHTAKVGVKHQNNTLVKLVREDYLESNYRKTSGNWPSSVRNKTREFGFSTTDNQGNVAFLRNGNNLDMYIDGDVFVGEHYNKLLTRDWYEDNQFVHDSNSNSYKLKWVYANDTAKSFELGVDYETGELTFKDSYSNQGPADKILTSNIIFQVDDNTLKLMNGNTYQEITSVELPVNTTHTSDVVVPKFFDGNTLVAIDLVDNSQYNNTDFRNGVVFKSKYQNESNKLSFFNNTNRLIGKLEVRENDGFRFSTNVYANSFYETSLRKYKTNIKPFETSGLELINGLNIVEFDKEGLNKRKIGIIADDTDKRFLSENMDAVDLYDTIFIQAKAIQELTKELQELKNQMKEYVKTTGIK